METGAIELVAIMTPIINGVLIFIMFGLGTSLKIEDFKRLITEPKYMGLGLFNQVLVLPLIGLLFIQVFDLYVGVAAGIMLILACPGGNLSNLLTHFAKGDLALSISLTAISTCFSVFMLPLWLHIAFRQIGSDSLPADYSTINVVIQVFLTTVLPVFVGMFASYRFPKLTEKIEKVTRIFALTFLVVIMLGITFQDPSGVVNNITTLVPLAFALSAATMFFGWQSARLLKIPGKQLRTITLETGIQNVPLALAVSTGALNNLEMAVFPTLYGFAMIFVGVAVVLILTFRGRRIEL